MKQSFKIPNLEVISLLPTKFLTISKVQKEVLEQLKDVFIHYNLSDVKIPRSIQPATSILTENKPILLTKRKGKIIESLNEYFKSII